MSGGKLRGESFCIAGCFSNRLVFLFKFLLRESWPTSEMGTTEGEDTLFPRGIVLSLQKETGNLSAHRLHTLPLDQSLPTKCWGKSYVPARNTTETLSGLWVSKHWFVMKGGTFKPTCKKQILWAPWVLLTFLEVQHSNKMRHKFIISKNTGKLFLSYVEQE